MIPEFGCVFDGTSGHLPAELLETMLETPNFQLERIVSTGHRTAEGEWYDQDDPEWVILLQGSASLRFEGQDELVPLSPGDYINIPAHCRHRVESTDPDRPTVWLAIHYKV